MFFDSLQQAKNTVDLLEGCVNRFFVTHDLEELKRLYPIASLYLIKLYFYHLSRLESEQSSDQL